MQLNAGINLFVSIKFFGLRISKSFVLSMWCEDSSACFDIGFAVTIYQMTHGPKYPYYWTSYLAIFLLLNRSHYCVYLPHVMYTSWIVVETICMKSNSFTIIKVFKSFKSYSISIHGSFVLALIRPSVFSQSGSMERPQTLSTIIGLTYWVNEHPWAYIFTLTMYGHRKGGKWVGRREASRLREPWDTRTGVHVLKFY